VAPYLLVLAHSRSGSTHLLDLLGALSGVASLGEFFSRQPKNQLVKFIEESLEPYGSNAALADAAITNPLETLAFREQLDGVNLFVVKVLGQHLRDDRARRILIDNAVGVIVLRRNPFSAWVSRALVDQSKTWENAGTARFAVRFDEAFFLDRARAYSTQIRDFLRLVTASETPFVSLTYSDLIALGNPTALWSFLREEIPTLPELELDAAWVPRVHRQDERKPIDRIGNRDEALASLERLGLGYLTEDADTDDLEYLLSVLVKKRQPSPFQRLVSVVTQRVRRAPKR